MVTVGHVLGEKFRIDETNANRYSGPSIEALDHGGYIVTWYDERFGLNDPDQTGLKGRIFGPNSLPELISPGSVSVVENTTPVLTLQDSDLDVNARLTYAIGGGPTLPILRSMPRPSRCASSIPPISRAPPFTPTPMWRRFR